MITADENAAADHEVMKLANHNGKLAIGITYMVDARVCEAINRGLENGWLTLLTWACMIEARPGFICSVFALTDTGKARLAELSSHFERKN
jgi:hypothetical protein